MAKIDEEIQKLYRLVLNTGKFYHNKRRNSTRLQIPSYTFRHSFTDGFPAISNKELYFKSIVGELIWFLRGDNDIKWLNENGIKIWNKDAYNYYKTCYDPQDGPKESFDMFDMLGTGSVGQNYSRQWRDYNGEVDQIANLIRDMKKDIMGSRLKVTAWNPSELDKTALPPCHTDFQIIGVPLGLDNFGFELHWTQRSTDLFLGLPFDIATFGILAKLLESITGYKALAIEGNLKCVHFYDNQYEPAKTLLNRSPRTHSKCELLINKMICPIGFCVDEFKTFEIADFELVGYRHDPGIPCEMLAPNE